MDLSSLLSYLRALYQAYQHMHWKSQGQNYYGDHLLFQRLYEDVQAEVDLVAEKTIGITNDVGSIDNELKDSLPLAEKMLDGNDYPKQAVEVEKGLLDLVKQLMGSNPSDGVQNLLQSIADKHEEHVYLLQQRAKTKGAGMLVKLYKLAHNLDKDGLYTEASEVDAIMKDLVVREKLSPEDVVRVADYLDEQGDREVADMLDTAIKQAMANK